MGDVAFSPSLALSSLASIEAYEGGEPAEFRSAHYAVELRHGAKATALQPFVYETASPDDDLDSIHPPSFCALLVLQSYH